MNEKLLRHIRILGQVSTWVPGMPNGVCILWEEQRWNHETSCSWQMMFPRNWISYDFIGNVGASINIYTMDTMGLFWDSKGTITFSADGMVSLQTGWKLPRTSWCHGFEVGAHGCVAIRIKKYRLHEWGLRWVDRLPRIDGRFFLSENRVKHQWCVINSSFHESSPRW